MNTLVAALKYKTGLNTVRVQKEKYVNQQSRHDFLQTHQEGIKKKYTQKRRQVQKMKRCETW